MRSHQSCGQNEVAGEWRCAFLADVRICGEIADNALETRDNQTLIDK